MKITSKIILLLFTFIFFVSGCTYPYQKTEIVSEEPLIIGYITDINEEKQVIHVVENISKEDALNGVTIDIGSWVQMNNVIINDVFEIGNKVAIWDSPINENSSKEERKAMPLAKNIVLIEK
ncbi:hypothetical protein RGU12_00290 [Fredinandcohnia sp. QZ13]|uniref:hypothetical protein n=1 Tax=Fredinandcohnia sp. QZ13 TaxID=3073144 RepID=UPI0028534686|nr:hypothetical protein [Fredinandcohnia sp. QZ13]MDR4885982.1 hypothetical protein [Fredinandcohnia sp. QZ13]